MENRPNSMNLLYCISHQYFGFLVCSLKSVFLHGGYEHYEVYIFPSYEDFSMEKTLFRSFGSQMSFHVVQPTDLIWDRVSQNVHGMDEKLHRFLVPYLLPEEIDRILYLDADTIVINSLQELYETPFDGSPVIACTYAKEGLTKINEARQQADKPVLKLNSGVMLLDLATYRSTISLSDAECCILAKKPRGISPDRYVFASLCGNQVKLADPMRFNLSDKALYNYNTERRHEQITQEWIQKNTSVIHFYGNPKPGNAEYSSILNHFYKKLFDEKT